MVKVSQFKFQYLPPRCAVYNLLRNGQLNTGDKESTEEGNEEASGEAMDVDDSDSNSTTQNNDIEEEENVKMVNNDMNNDTNNDILHTVDI